MFLVDANVLLDVVLDDPVWAPWSADALATSRRVGLLFINIIVFAEVAAGLEQRALVEAALPVTEFGREDIPWEAGYLAGRAHSVYRQRGGARTTTLPDFFIGAHASIRGYTLITRDATRYRTYFPELAIVAPS